MWCSARSKEEVLTNIYSDIKGWKHKTSSNVILCWWEWSLSPCSCSWYSQGSPAIFCFITKCKWQCDCWSQSHSVQLKDNIIRGHKVLFTVKLEYKCFKSFSLQLHWDNVSWILNIQMKQLKDKSLKLGRISCTQKIRCWQEFSERVRCWSYNLSAGKMWF